MKLPAFQFYTGDWLKDPKLSMCLPATRGIWIDAIAAMHEDCRSGVLSGTPGQLVRVLRCTKSALMAAIDDLRSTGTADVTERNGTVTLINRRMFREAKERESNRLRQSKHRGNGNHTPDVTGKSPPYSSSSPSSSDKDPPTPQGKNNFRKPWARKADVGASEPPTPEETEQMQRQYLADLLAKDPKQLTPDEREYIALHAKKEAS